MYMEQSLAVSADLLRPGLYVNALDRPWVETPFAFQGFRIAGDDEIKTLRAYCKYVFVDLARSEPDAAEAVMAAGRRRPLRPEQLGSRTARAVAGQPLPAEIRACCGSLFEPVTHPDRSRFARLVQTASDAHDAAGEAVHEALACLQRERAVNISRAARAVDAMRRLMREDASPALWLTRLRRHDHYLGDHSANACALALAFGAYLGMEDKALHSLGLGTLLMDVGMARIPRELLARERALSATERAVVRKHVALGCARLSRDGLPAEALAIVGQHHERLGGQGYPGGLVDSYDAMTTDRPYRAALRPDEALQSLYRDAATSFGTELVEAFIRCLGPWPAGTLVELDDGAVAAVVGSRPGAGPWPTVLLLRRPTGEPCHRRRLLNLAAGEHHIQRALEPRATGIDIGRVVAAEFGLGRTAAA